EDVCAGWGGHHDSINPYIRMDDSSRCEPRQGRRLSLCQFNCLPWIAIPRSLRSLRMTFAPRALHTQTRQPPNVAAVAGRACGSTVSFHTPTSDSPMTSRREFLKHTGVAAAIAAANSALRPGIASALTA